MTVFGNRVFADAIKIRIKMRSCEDLGSQSNEGVLMRDRKEHRDPYRR